MEIPVYFDNVDLKRQTVIITPETTIAQLKSMITKLHLGYYRDNYSIRFTFGNNQELSPFLFTTNQYDDLDFSWYKDVLAGSKIWIGKNLNTEPINTEKSNTEKSNTEPDKTMVYVYMDNAQENKYASTDKVKVLQFVVDHKLQGYGFTDLEDMFTNLYGIDETPNLKIPSHQEAVIDQITERNDYFIETQLH